MQIALVTIQEEVMALIYRKLTQNLLPMFVR